MHITAAYAFRLASGQMTEPDKNYHVSASEGKNLLLRGLARLAPEVEDDYQETLPLLDEEVDEDLLIEEISHEE